MLRSVGGGAAGGGSVRLVTGQTALHATQPGHRAPARGREMDIHRAAFSYTALEAWDGMFPAAAGGGRFFFAKRKQKLIRDVGREFLRSTRPVYETGFVESQL